MNDEDRAQWCDNDEGLYRLMQMSGLSKTRFVRANRKKIDAVVEALKQGKPRPPVEVFASNDRPWRTKGSIA